MQNSLSVEQIVDVLFQTKGRVTRDLETGFAPGNRSLQRAFAELEKSGMAPDDVFVVAVAFQRAAEVAVREYWVRELSKTSPPQESMFGKIITKPDGLFEFWDKTAYLGYRFRDGDHAPLKIVPDSDLAQEIRTLAMKAVAAGMGPAKTLE